jgi:TfoX/Sxy family transcriptional regulator of competence genes
MATSKDFIAYLQDCLRRVPGISFRAMFGEYAMYADGVVVALVCDQTPFIKVTEGTTALLGDRVRLGHPYPGAKPAYMLTEGELEDDELMSQVISAALRDLAARPKPARKKTPRKSAGKKAKRKSAPKPGGKPVRRPSKKK